MNIFLALMFFTGLLLVLLVGVALSHLIDVLINWFTSGE